jgi:hypothetical protein
MSENCVDEKSGVVIGTEKYTLVDVPPPALRGGRAWSDLVNVARRNPGKWVRRDREYKGNGSTIVKHLKQRYGVEAVTRSGYIYLRHINIPA